MLLEQDRWVYAMCALDALGIPFLLSAPAEIHSRDPVSDDEVWVRVDPGEGSWSKPAGAVVVCGSIDRPGPSALSCCTVLNFFSSGANAERYLHEQTLVSGVVISLPVAVETGRQVFGDLLTEGRERDD